MTLGFMMKPWEKTRRERDVLDNLGEIALVMLGFSVIAQFVG
jgi:hypothetical protein